MLALITGGSGSGKSAWAERLAAAVGAERRYYIATMRAYDKEAQKRVERHRRQRKGKGFTTIEQPMDLLSARIDAGSCVLLECLPNLLANEMFDGGDPQRILPAIEALCERCAQVIVVTDDVFCDGETYDPSTQAYMRKLAELHRQIAEQAEHVVEVVCGIPIAVKGEKPCI